MIPVPELGRSRWREGLTADGMKKCIWAIRRRRTHFTGYRVISNETGELCRVNTAQSTRAVARPASLRHHSGIG